jgi:predicted  nucleic acid-binding Zn-ribbon protein
MGLETRLSLYGESEWDERAHAGLEDLPRCDGSPERLPYVIKGPWMCETIDRLLAAPGMVVDAVVVPVRDLVEAATSRIILERQALNRTPMAQQLPAHSWEHWGFTAGGAVFSLNPIDQGRVLAVLFHRMMERLTKADIPVVLLAFPKLVQDADYLFHKLKHLLPNTITVEAARCAHSLVADANKIRTDREVQQCQTGEVCTEIADYSYPRGHELDLIAMRRELQRLQAIQIDAKGWLEEARRTTDTLNEQLAICKQGLGQETARANRLEIELTQAHHRLADQENRLSDLRAASFSDQERISVLQEHVEVYAGRARTLETELAQANNRVSETTTQLLDLRTQCSSDGSAITALQAHIVRANAELNEIRARELESGRQLAMRVSDIERLELQLTELQQECTAFQVKAADYEAVLATYVAERERMFNSHSWRYTRPLRSLTNFVRAICLPLVLKRES